MEIAILLTVIFILLILICTGASFALGFYVYKKYKKPMQKDLTEEQKRKDREYKAALDYLMSYNGDSQEEH